MRGARAHVRAVRALCVADCVELSSSSQCMVSPCSAADIHISLPCFFRSTRQVSSTLPVTVRKRRARPGVSRPSPDSRCEYGGTESARRASPLAEREIGARNALGVGARRPWRAATAAATTGCLGCAARMPQSQMGEMKYYATGVVLGGARLGCVDAALSVPCRLCGALPMVVSAAGSCARSDAGGRRVLAAGRVHWN